jgi:hypothetical protein
MFFSQTFQNGNNFLTEKYIFNAIEICSNICFHSDMTLTLHWTWILWNFTDLKVIIVLARKWNLFDVNPGFSCQVIEFVLQFPMIYSMRVFFSDWSDIMTVEMWIWQANFWFLSVYISPCNCSVLPENTSEPRQATGDSQCKRIPGWPCNTCIYLGWAVQLGVKSTRLKR